jgi:hypothetical protein
MNNPFKHEGQSDDQPSKFRLRQNWCTLFISNKNASTYLQYPTAGASTTYYKWII